MEKPLNFSLVISIVKSPRKCIITQKQKCAQQFFKRVQSTRLYISSSLSYFHSQLNVIIKKGKRKISTKNYFFFFQFCLIRVSWAYNNMYFKIFENRARNFLVGVMVDCLLNCNLAHMILLTFLTPFFSLQITGNTPLMMAVKDNKTPLIDRLIELGSDVCARNNVS